jgi:hypothetical protein
MTQYMCYFLDLGLFVKSNCMCWELSRCVAAGVTFSEEDRWIFSELDRRLVSVIHNTSDSVNSLADEAWLQSVERRARDLGDVLGRCSAALDESACRRRVDEEAADVINLY